MLRSGIFVSLCLLGGLFACALYPATATAQGVVVDEGTFRLTVEGRVVGTETFTIRQSEPGTDVQLIARAEIQMERPEGRVGLQPLLQATGSDMGVTAYQIKVSGQRSEEIRVQLDDRRFTTTTRSEVGERQQQSRAAPGTLLLDTDVAHQYYFLAARLGSEGGTVPVIVPRAGQQFDLRVTVVGSESVQIGGAAVGARHLRLEGQGETRDLWVDGEGRVLRLDYPAAGYSAVRTERP